MAEEFEDLSFAGEVAVVGGAVVFAGFGFAFGVGIGFDPADGVEAFLEDIVRAGDEVVIFPEAEAAVVVIRAGDAPAAGEADGAQRGRAEFPFFEDRMDDLAAAHSAEFGGAHFVIGGAGDDFDFITR